MEHQKQLSEILEVAPVPEEIKNTYMPIGSRSGKALKQLKIHWITVFYRLRSII
jgi:hypothetical protein